MISPNWGYLASLTLTQKVTRTDVGRVEMAVVEIDGSISVVPTDEHTNHVCGFHPGTANRVILGQTVLEITR